MKKITVLLLCVLVGNMFISQVQADDEETVEVTTPETFAQFGTLRFDKYPLNRGTVAMPKQPVVDGVYKDEIFSYNVSMTYTGSLKPAFVLSMQPGIRYEGYTLLKFKNTQGIEKNANVIKTYQSGNDIVFLFTEIEQFDIIQFDVHFTATGEIGSTINGTFGCWQGISIDWKHELDETMGINPAGWVEAGGEYTGTLPTGQQVFNETSDVSTFWFGDNHPMTPTKIIERDTPVIPPVDPSIPLVPLVPAVPPVKPIVPVVPVQPEAKPSIKPSEKNSTEKVAASVSTADSNSTSDLMYLIILSGGVMLLAKKMNQPE